MNWEQQLELQAWVDGELPETDARRVAAMVETNPTARALAEELRMARQFISANEPEAVMPETPDFYLSQVRRRIEAADRVGTSVSTVPWYLMWRRFLAPLSGVALVVFLGIVSFNSVRPPAVDDGSRFMVEVENLSDDIGSISYRSQAENMFVVYLYKKDQDVDSEAQSDSLDNSFFQ